MSLRRGQENAVRQVASHGREKVKEVWKINLKMPLRQEIDREGKLILVTCFLDRVRIGIVYELIARWWEGSLKRIMKI